MSLMKSDDKSSLFKLTTLFFGLFTFPVVFIMIVIIFLSLLSMNEFTQNLMLLLLSTSQLEQIFELLFILRIISFYLVFIGFLVLAYGVYSHASKQIDPSAEEGRKIAIYLLIFSVSSIIVGLFGGFLSLMIGDPNMDSTLELILSGFLYESNYEILAIIWVIALTISSIFLIFLTIKFSTWINQLTNQQNRVMIWAGSFYLISALFVTLSVVVLFPFTSTTPLSDFTGEINVTSFQDVIESQIIAYYALLLSFGSQFIASLKLFLDLRKEQPNALP